MLQNILQTKVCCIRLSLLENLMLFSLMCMYLYTSLRKRLRDPTTSGRKKKKTKQQVHSLFYIPISPTSWNTGLTQTRHRKAHAETCAMAKCYLYHPGKWYWSCFKFIICDWSLTVFILSSEKHMLETYLDTRVSSGWSNTPCTITWLDTGSTILITEGNCQGWKSRAAQSSSSPQLCKTNSKIKPPPNMNKLPIGQL